MSKSWSGFTAGGYGWRSWRNTFVEYTLPGTTWDGWYPYDDEHAWVNEMEWAYLLTGDKLYLDNLIGLGEIFKARLEGWARKTIVGPRSFAWSFELVRINYSLTGDSEAYQILKNAIDTLATHNQNGYYGNLNGESLGTQTFQMAMIANHLSTFWREIPEGHLKRRLFGVLMGIGDYLTIHSWADDNRGVGRRPSEKPTPYYSNDDIGDIPALLYSLTGRSELKEKTRLIAQNLGTRWSSWKGGRAGRMVTYVLKTPRGDTIAPGTISDLKAWRTEGDPDRVLLEWTAPEGALRYDIRGSSKNIVERMDSPTDTTSSMLWWKAMGFAHHQKTKPESNRIWSLVRSPGASEWNFAIRAFDSQGDEANMGPLSQAIKPVCCFNPDTLPAAQIPKNARHPTFHQGAVKMRVNTGKKVLEVEYSENARNASNRNGDVLVRIFNAKGRVVANLGTLSRTRTMTTWNWENASAGFYWMEARQRNHIQTEVFLRP
jgi:hypothetical protein